MRGPCLLIFYCFCLMASSQTTVTGKVTEAVTGAPVPYATVVFVGTTDGAITDFDGNFSATTSSAVDSIAVTYIGFNRRVKAVQPGEKQVINFQMEESSTSLEEVVVIAGENPAFEILRRINKNKKSNDKRELDAYEYESYVRSEIDADNLSDDLWDKKYMQKVSNLLDSIETIAGEDGRPVLPVFISEALSRFYYRKDPKARHEEMVRTRVSGLGITDGSLTSQVIGGTFQEYNFYQNWLNIVEKEFPSPIADGGRLVYEYYLTDSLYIEDDFCYQIEFFPRQEQDLAFSGNMWITKDEYALRRIDAHVSKKANLNLVQKIRVQQDLFRVGTGHWLPSKTRVVLQFRGLGENSPGFIGKFYVSNKDFIINQVRENSLYVNAVSLDPNVRFSDNTFWEENRHDSLTSTETNVFLMIDSLKAIPRVKLATEAAKFLGNGYLKAGKLDLGPYYTFFGNNNIEGVRIGFGARTNIDFSQKLVLGGYVGHGFDDEKWKYQWYVKGILDREKWTTIKYEQQFEVDQVWLLNENIDPNSFFYAFSRFGTLTQPFIRRKQRVDFQRQLTRGLNVNLFSRNEKHQALFDFLVDRGDGEASSSYRIAEIGAEVRYGKDEIWVVNDNERFSLGTIRSPLFELKYSRGLDTRNGHFDYHKLQASVKKKVKMGVLGITEAELGGGCFFGEAPYTMLFNPIGNESPVFVGFAYNLMDYFEFSADKYVEVKLRHSFEGFLLNRVPLLKKLKMRAILSGNAFFGGLSEDTDVLIISDTLVGAPSSPPYRSWGSRPYVEVGYGLSNIARFFSIQAFHRISYLDINAQRTGVKFSVDFKL